MENSKQSDSGQTGENRFLAGFSGTEGGLGLSLFEEAAGQELFRCCETTVQLLDDMGIFRRKRFLDQFECVYAGGVVDEGASLSILRGSKRTREVFSEELGRTFSRLEKYGVSGATLNLAPEIFMNGEDSLRLKHLLQSLYKILEEDSFSLLLPFRVPAKENFPPRLLIRFLETAMIPRVKAHLMVSPHDLKRDFSPRILAENLRFDTECVTFLYDAENGNYLVKEHLEKWFEYFALTGFRGPFFAAPLSHGGRLAVQGSKMYAELIRIFEMEHHSLK